MNFVPAMGDGAGMGMKILGGDGDGGTYIRIRPAPLTSLCLVKRKTFSLKNDFPWKTVFKGKHNSKPLFLCLVT